MVIEEIVAVIIVFLYDVLPEYL